MARVTIPARMTLHSGMQLGPYRILAPLGAGGMGEVYRALDTRLDREVAVKVLPAGSVGDASAETRFDRRSAGDCGPQSPEYLFALRRGARRRAGILRDGAPRG